MAGSDVIMAMIIRETLVITAKRSYVQSEMISIIFTVYERSPGAVKKVFVLTLFLIFTECFNFNIDLVTLGGLS
jgi:hypothetical protein